MAFFCYIHLHNYSKGSSSREMQMLVFGLELLVSLCHTAHCVRKTHSAHSDADLNLKLTSQPHSCQLLLVEFCFASWRIETRLWKVTDHITDVRLNWVEETFAFGEFNNLRFLRKRAFLCLSVRIFCSKLQLSLRNQSSQCHPLISDVMLQFLIVNQW